MKNVHDASCKFPDYMSEIDLLHLLMAAKLSKDFGHVAFPPYRILLRVPSETMQMRLSAPADKITEFPPKSIKLRVGVSRVEAADMITPDFARRRDIRLGFFLRRPGLWRGESSMGRILCPAHQVWPRIVARSPTHGFLSPRLEAPMFNIELNRGSNAADMGRGEKSASRFLHLWELRIAPRKRHRSILATAPDSGGGWDLRPISIRR